MKRIVKNSLFTAILMVWGMMYSSCEDWTDPESINIHYSTFEEQNPQLYADYIRDLKRYKDGEHKLVFVSFDNPETNPINQTERLTAIPDSVDFICLNNPEKLSSETQAEMVKIREKNIRTLSCINYESLEQEWNNKAKDNSELTEEDAQRYLNERTDAMLVLCDNYGYDGIIQDFQWWVCKKMCYNNTRHVSKTSSAECWIGGLSIPTKHWFFTVMCSI